MVKKSVENFLGRLEILIKQSDFSGSLETRLPRGFGGMNRRREIRSEPSFPIKRCQSKIFVKITPFRRHRQIATRKKKMLFFFPLLIFPFAFIFTFLMSRYGRSEKNP